MGKPGNQLVRVYRWEDELGHGPYNSERRGMALPQSVKERLDALVLKLCNHKSVDGVHKIPHQEGLDMSRGKGSWNMWDKKNWFCGFHNLRVMKKWFDAKERRLLREAGFFMVSYLVPQEDFQRGESQCCFRKVKAVKEKVVYDALPE